MGGILACHGTPTNDNQYLVEEVSEHRLVRAHSSTIEKRLGDVQARVVLCGHSHQQHLIRLPNGPLILNPGSVGCPSYDDPGAEPHVSESGSPHARYAVLTVGEQGSAEVDRRRIRLKEKRRAARAEEMGDQNGLTACGRDGSCQVLDNPWAVPSAISARQDRPTPAVVTVKRRRKTGCQTVGNPSSSMHCPRSPLM